VSWSRNAERRSSFSEVTGDQEINMERRAAKQKQLKVKVVMVGFFSDASVVKYFSCAMGSIHL